MEFRKDLFANINFENEKRQTKNSNNKANNMPKFPSSMLSLKIVLEVTLATRHQASAGLIKLIMLRCDEVRKNNQIKLPRSTFFKIHNQLNVNFYQWRVNFKCVQ